MDVNLRLTESEVGKIEEESLPLFLKMFEEFELPVSLAIRGQLMETDSLFMRNLLASKVNHDVGSHGYYHRQFTDLTAVEAEDELQKISVGMKKYGLTPKTFIFPRNCVAHLDLLEKYGYFCYRGYGSLLKDTMLIEKNGKLYNVHPSIFIDQHSNLALLKRMLDASVAKRLPFHMWFHFWSFGENEKVIAKNLETIFYPLLRHAKQKQVEGSLKFETMLSATQKVA